MICIASTPYAIRWLMKYDLGAVCAMESATSFDWCCPLSANEIIKMLRQRNTIGLVAEHGKHVVGYTIYELGKIGVEVRRLVVYPAHRREGVGTLLVDRLKTKLDNKRRSLRAVVHERNLTAQLFLKAQRFECVGSLPTDGDEDRRYSFRFDR